MKFLVYILFFTVTTESNAHANLETGCGGYILQIIIAFLAAIGATLSFYWSKLKLFLSKLFKKKNNDKLN